MGLEDEKGLDRRELLKRGAIFGAVVSMPFGTTVANAFASAGQAVAPSALPPSSSAILAAIFERLIPADENGPGSAALGITGFVENGLQGGLAGGLSAAMPLYEAGLPAVDAYAQSAYGGPFVSLSGAQQDAVLADVQSGKATGFPPDLPNYDSTIPFSTVFFQAMREHAVEGMFSDPVYGGNKNAAGWILLGYPGVRMPVTAAQQQLGLMKMTQVPQSTYANGQFPKAKKEAVA